MRKLSGREGNFVSNFNYLHADGANNFLFFKLPKILFTDERFSGISNTSKLLYGFLEDKVALSYKKKTWDDEGRVYVFFPLTDVQKYLGVSSNTACKLFKELEQIGLIVRKKSGGKTPEKIYIADISKAQESDVENHVENDVESSTTRKNCKSPFLIDETNDVKLSLSDYLPDSGGSMLKTQTDETDVSDEMRDNEAMVKDEVKRQINFEWLLAQSVASKETLELIVALISDIYLQNMQLYYLDGAVHTEKSLEAKFRKLNDEHIV